MSAPYAVSGRQSGEILNTHMTPHIFKLQPTSQKQMRPGVRAGNHDGGRAPQGGIFTSVRLCAPFMGAHHITNTTPVDVPRACRDFDTGFAAGLADFIAGVRHG